jgi:hypothetical protein
MAMTPMILHGALADRLIEKQMIETEVIEVDRVGKVHRAINEVDAIAMMRRRLRAGINRESGQIEMILLSRPKRNGNSGAIPSVFSDVTNGMCPNEVLCVKFQPMRLVPEFSRPPFPGTNLKAMPVKGTRNAGADDVHEAVRSPSRMRFQGCPG